MWMSPSLPRVTPRRTGAALSAALLVLVIFPAVGSGPAQADPSPVTGVIALDATAPTAGGTGFGGDVSPTDTGGIAVGFYRDISIEPPAGAQLTPGRITLTPGGAPNEPVVNGGTGTCASTTASLGPSSYLDVREATYDASGHLSSFAADFALDCGWRVPVRQIRLNTAVPYATASATATRAATFTGIPGTGTATLVNAGTTTLHPTGATLSLYGGATPTGATVITDGCSGSEVIPGASCQVTVAALSPGVDVNIALAELTDLAPARDGLQPAVSARPSVQEFARPSPVVSAAAIPATDGIEVVWSIGAGEPWPDFRIDRRTGTGDWVRIPGDVQGDRYADTAASTTQPSTYRIVPVSPGGEDLTGAKETASATPASWSLPVGATTLASVDGMGLVSTRLSVTSEGATIASQPNLGVPGVLLTFPRSGLRLGSQPVDPTAGDVAHACWKYLGYPSDCAPITGTITVTRLARHADGTPVELAATLSGTKTVNGVTAKTSALMVLNSVAAGLPAYVVADPGVVSTPMPLGIDQTFSLTLRNVGGTAGALASPTLQSPMPSVWSLTVPCTGILIQPGDSCTARARAAYNDMAGGLAWSATAVWQGSAGLVTSAILEGLGQDNAEPVVSITSPPVVGATGAITLTAADPQGDQVALWCRLDNGSFVSCSSPWTMSGLKQGTHTVTAYGTDPQSHMSAWVRTQFKADLTGPVTTITSPTAGAVILRSPTTLFWSLNDFGVGAAYIQAHVRIATPTTAMGGYFVPRSTAAVRSNAVSFAITPGSEECWAARSYDLFHVWGAWSTERCFARPLDDTALAPAGGFQREFFSSTVYGAIFSSARRAGATLSVGSVRTRQIGVMIYMCPTCGSFDVHVGSTWLGRLSATRTTSGWTTLWLPHQSTERRGTLTIRTTSSRQVSVDGLIIRHL